jgi:hypothetical protein
MLMHRSKLTTTSSPQAAKTPLRSSELEDGVSAVDESLKDGDRPGKNDEHDEAPHQIC